MKGINYVNIRDTGMVKKFLENLPKPQFVSLIHDSNANMYVVWYQANVVIVKKDKFMKFLQSNHHSGNYSKFVDEEHDEDCSLTDDGISYCAKMGFPTKFE